MSNEFSVCQFFANQDLHEYVRRYVSLGEAIEAYRFYTSNVAARSGMVDRVIITDGGDSIVAEWVYGAGTVWPK